MSSRALRQQLCAKLRSLPPQELLEECCKAAIYLGEYHWLTGNGATAALLLDSMNYSPRVFEDVLPLSLLTQAFEIRGGYGTVTGEDEIGPIVRAYELFQATRYAQMNGMGFSASAHKAVEDAAVVVTAGATGAVHIALRAILRHKRALSGRSGRVIVYNAPCYPLAEAHARNLGLSARPVWGDQFDGYLASPGEIKAACGEDTLVCLLTLPTNPMQVSWPIEQRAQVKELIQYCQSREITIVVDTIFQDLSWRVPQLEFFGLVESNRDLIKVFSPSKDRPGANGHRIGYLIGDPQFRKAFETEKLLASNSSSTLAQAWMAFDLVFRLALLKGGLTSHLFDPLSQTAFLGYDVRRLSSDELFQRSEEASLYELYRGRVTNFYHSLDESLGDVHSWLNSSKCFEAGPRPPYGNTLVATVRTEYTATDSAEFFVNCLAELGVAASIGECFEFPTDGRIRFRIVSAGNSSEQLIRGLERIQDYIVRGHA